MVFFPKMGIASPVAVLSSTGRSKALSGTSGAKLLGATLISAPVSIKIAQLPSGCSYALLSCSCMMFLSCAEIVVLSCS